MDSTSLSKMGLRKWKKSTSKSRAQSTLASVSSKSEDDIRSKEMEKEKTDTSHPTAPPPTRATTRHNELKRGKKSILHSLPQRLSPAFSEIFSEGDLELE